MMTQKAKYIRPTCEVERFCQEDVLTSSGEQGVRWSARWTNDDWSNDWANKLGGNE